MNNKKKLLIIVKLVSLSLLVAILLTSCKSDDNQFESFNDTELLESFDENKYPLIKKGIDEYEDGKYTDAIATCYEAEKKYGGHKSNYLNLGTAYGQLENYPDAIIALTKCLDLDKNFVPALLNRGLFYGYTNQYSEAEKDLKKVIKLLPQEPGSYINLSVVYDLQGKHQKSCNMINKAIALGAIEKYGNQAVHLKDIFCK